MPELPEVEFCARKLRGWLDGRRIDAVEATPGRPLYDIDPVALARALVGRRIEGIRRVGKQIFVDTSGGQCLLVHLGMTGKWVPRVDGKRKHAHVSIRVDDGCWFDFLDPRKFGRVRLLPMGALATDPEVQRIGPDALALSAQPRRLHPILQRTKRAIKVALLDQSLLAGVGNIYAAEALHRVRVDPRTPAHLLTPRKSAALARALGAVMTESLERETADEITYLQEARAKNPFDVYGREGESCTQCGGEIRRFVQQGRSTFWCPRCQRPKT